MSSSEGYVAYCEYTALKLHFTTDSYDYFKYHGKTRANPNSFNKDKYKWVYVKLERLCENNKQKIRDYLVSCFLHNQKAWITNVFDVEYTDAHRQRMSIVDKLSKEFTKHKQQFSKFALREYVVSIDGEYSQLVYDLMSGDISYELYVMYDSKYNLTPYYLDCLDDDFAYPSKIKTIEKYKGFLL